MDPNFRKIYDRVRRQSEILGLNTPEDDLRRKAWMLGNRDLFERSGSPASSAPASSSSAGAGGTPMARISNFDGYYSVRNWNAVEPDDSSVDTSGAPTGIRLNGVDEGSINAFLDFTITIPASGKINFTWRYSTEDSNNHSISATDNKVDIGVFTVGSNVEVRLRPRSNFNGVVSSIIFAVRWDDPNTTLGTLTQDALPESYLAISRQGGVMQDDGKRYQIYSGSGFSTLTSLGTSWVAGHEYTVATIPVTKGSASGVFNDDWTSSNNGNYFISLSGEDQTGVIYTLPAPSYDRFVIIRGDDLIQLSDDNGESTQSGKYEISVEEGQTFGFRIDPTDGMGGRAIVSIDGFSAPIVPVVEIEAPII